MSERFVATPVKHAARINREVLPESTPDDAEIRYVDIGAVGRGSFVDDPEPLRFGAAPSRARRVALPGDVLLSTVRTYLRGVAQLGSDDEPVVASTGFATLTPSCDVHARFLYYAVLSDAFIEEVVARSVGVSYPAIAPSELASVSIPLPPLEVQRRIADYLDAETRQIDALRTSNDALRHLVRERHERFVMMAVAEGVGYEESVSSGEIGWLDRVAEGFPIGPYALYARTGSGHTPSRSMPEYWLDCDIPWVTTADVQRLREGFEESLTDTVHKISRLGMANSAARLHPTGTVFLSRTASVGFAGVMSIPMATSQDFFTWTPDDRLTPDYLLWSLRAMRYSGHFDRLMYGSTHKTIYVPDLMVLRGPVPPIEDQHRIVSAIREQRDETRRLLDGLERANRLLTERRTALITAAVTGELEV